MRLAEHLFLQLLHVVTRIQVVHFLAQLAQGVTGIARFVLFVDRRQDFRQRRVRLQQSLEAYQQGDELTVREKDGKVYVAMSDKLLFQSGSARLDKRGEEALGKLAEVLNKQTDIDVFIEGHTDNKPINTVQFKDNWDLSVIRATSVVRILIKNYNVNPLQIQPSGRGEYMPIDDNETIEGRSKNRRTEIIMAPKLDKLFQMLQSSEESK